MNSSIANSQVTNLRLLVASCPPSLLMRLKSFDTSYFPPSPAPLLFPGFIFTAVPSIIPVYFLLSFLFSVLLENDLSITISLSILFLSDVYIITIASSRPSLPVVAYHSWVVLLELIIFTRKMTLRLLNRAATVIYFFYLGSRWEMMSGRFSVIPI